MQGKRTKVKFGMLKQLLIPILIVVTLMSLIWISRLRKSYWIQFIEKEL